MQATAGNGATSRLLSRPSVQRDPVTPAPAPALDSRALAVMLQPTLQAERDSAFAEYHKIDGQLAELQQLEDAGDLTEKGKADKQTLVATQAEQEAKLGQAEKDLLLLNTPGTADQSLNELLVRRKANVSVPDSTDSTSSGWRLDNSGLTSSDKTVTTGVADGKAVTTTSGSTTTIDSTGWSKKDSQSTATTDGTTTNTSSTSDSKKIDVSGGDISYATGHTDKTETAGPLNSTSTTATSSKIGTGGYTKTTEQTETVDSTVASNKSTTSYTRGDGKVGTSSSSSSKFGTQDAQGNLIKGNENTKTVGVGVIAGQDGVGGYGSASQDLSQTHAKGVKTGQSVGMDGKFVVNVTQVAAKEPAQYQISLTISLGVKLSLSGNVDKESEAGNKGSYGVTGSAAGSVTGTFVHVFAEQETQAYLGSLANGSGGVHKELSVLQLAAAGSMDEAKTMLNGLKASLLSADGAAGMSDGDSAELAVEGKVSGGASGGASESGGLGGKADVSISHGGTLKRSVAHKGGKVVITITVLSSDGVGAGASVSYGAASGGYSGTEGTSAGQSVSFTLDPADASYQQRFAQIADTSSIDGLRRLAADHPELVGAKTTSSGSSSGGTTSAGVGPAKLELTDTHSYDESTTIDASGTSHTFAGSTGGGAAVSVAGGPKVSYSEKDAVATSVGADAKASGDASHATSETDLGASLDKLGQNLSSNPLGTVTGLVTGGTKVMQEKTDVAGMKLSDDDFATIAAVARDPHGWDRPVVSPRLLPDWRALRRAVVAANGDRTEIARCLAAYASHDEGAAHAIERIVRPVGSADGGARYEWPGDLSAEKSSYDSLVSGDPLAAVRSLEKDGKNAAALEAVNGVLSKLDAMVTAMQAKQDKFTDGAAFGEMLASAAVRRGEIAREAAMIGHRISAAGTTADLPASDVTTVPTADQMKAQDEIDRAAAKATLEGYRQSLNGFLEKQKRAFGIVQVEQAKKDAIFSSPDITLIATTLTDLKNNLYPQWDATLAKAREAAGKAGVDEHSVEPAPAKEYCNYLNKQTFGSNLV
ncbi:hypothetical protein [Fodinicola feengrottensis]|uniref:hypothetical protein n=1 Tax=Fodinicola feengrottensis TaxID=435914 RepID=UPI0031D6B4A2